jgi:hypothetical protein
MGGATEYMLEVLGIEMNIDEADYMQNWYKEWGLKGRFHVFGTSLFLARQRTITWQLILTRSQYHYLCSSILHTCKEHKYIYSCAVRKSSFEDEKEYEMNSFDYQASDDEPPKDEYRQEKGSRRRDKRGISEPDGLAVHSSL